MDSFVAEIVASVARRVSAEYRRTADAATNPEVAAVYNSMSIAADRVGAEALAALTGSPELVTA